jgi:hypothetical protein
LNSILGIISCPKKSSILYTVLTSFSPEFC